jgi:hypothetical protein
LWQSDGEVAGTHRVADIAPGPASSSPTGLTLSGNRLYFQADDQVSGRELQALRVAPAPHTKVPEPISELAPPP